MRIQLIMSSLSLLMLFAGCYYDKAENIYPSDGSGSCDTTNVTYTAKIKNITDTYCVNGCHNSKDLSGGLDFSDLAVLKDQAINGQLLCDIQQTCNPMPKGGKLSSCNLTLMEIWIRNNCPQ